MRVAMLCRGMIDGLEGLARLGVERLATLTRTDTGYE